MTAEHFEVADPDKAMGKFQLLLGKVVKIPKGEVQAKRKSAKAPPKRKRKR